MNPSMLELIHGLKLSDLSPEAEFRTRRLVADTIAVSIAGRPAPASEIAATHAAATYGSGRSRSLLDGTSLSPIGAAWANGVLANVLDLDDGHRLTKGHPGAMIIPGALALAEHRDASLTEFLEAVAVGYEVSVRAGIEQHRTDPAYHASGSWGALGVAAAGARLLGLDSTQTLNAIGLAEYHGPLAPIMRTCADPAMTKDACDLGARIGVESALLAEQGFTASRGALLDAEGIADELGSRWCVEEIYVKDHPCCRWTQGAIRAALELRAAEGIEAEAIERVEIRTFAAANGLSKVIPETTEQAQYNIVWPVAMALARGRFGVDEVLGPFDERQVSQLTERCQVVVDPELDARFPAERLTAVEITTAAGRFGSEPREPRGEPDDPGWAAIIEAKVARHIDPLRSGEADGDSVLSRLPLDQLISGLAPVS